MSVTNPTLNFPLVELDVLALAPPLELLELLELLEPHAATATASTTARPNCQILPFTRSPLNWNESATIATLRDGMSNAERRLNAAFTGTILRSE